MSQLQGHMRDSAESSTVHELRRLYRDAESQAARLRFIVDVHGLLDGSPFTVAAQSVLSRIAAFAGAQNVALSVKASHVQAPLEAVLGLSHGDDAWDVLIPVADGGVMARLALRLLPGRQMLAAEDREALDVTIRRIATTIGVERQATERERLLDEVAAQRTELAALVRRLIEVQEQERRRVAHDLHDGSAQTVAALGHRLETVIADLAETDVLRQELQGLVAMARRSVAEIRAAIAGLRPPELDGLGLPAALRARFDDLEDFSVTADLAPAAEGWPPAICLVLYRVAQEALANVVKHAGASRVTVRLFEEEDIAHLHVCDDGKGIAPTGPGVAGERLGIAGMRERLALLGGEFHIGRTKPRGTIVRACVPLRARPGSS
ncbi:sensor histidine kinase [Sinorhizobium garamanticum]|uniref:histidine kinase n=1 Tax=Sinorhizobium garamanticum TaxID=680247 RepID=A0ABY8DJ61_9HYPH|nr:sensor histidine kinase [Sinorhizobium garamanticum]WEX90951.1 sensor histidine kinase [Sinorhizobium garamanticum]